jgi:hypothetical protein
MRVPMASQYILQLSADDSMFSPATTVEVTSPVTIGDTFVTAEYLLSQVYINPKLQFAKVIWWRMGARVTGFPLPTGALGIANMNNWVFSSVQHFDLPSVPPPGSRMRGGQGVTIMPGMPKGSPGRPNGREGIFRH